MRRYLKFAVCGLMALGLIATAAAIVRASSLGIRVTDLSYDYCIAAIWANTELHLGIIATNLSLARSIYGYFTGRVTTSLNSTSGGTGNPSFVMNSYLSRSRKGDGSGEDGRPFDRVSDSSEVELTLSGKVVKTTEFTMEERARTMSKDGDNQEGYIVQKSWYDPRHEK